MPDDGTYFECTECELWFHPNCQGMRHKTTEAINKMKKAKCLDCQSKKVKSKKDK